MYIPTLNWEDINMEFVILLSLTRRQNDSIGVIVDTLAKSSNFIHVKFTYMAELYATIYIKVIVILYVIPLSITSDTGSQFTSRIWKAFQKCLGTQLKLSTAFHHQADGQV